VEQHIRKADDGDVEMLTALINRTYEPAESFLFDGPRVTAGEIRQKLHRDAFLMVIGRESETRGAVYVECGREMGYAARQEAKFCRVIDDLIHCNREKIHEHDFSRPPCYPSALGLRL
jgi:hypothetical protein